LTSQALYFVSQVAYSASQMPSIASETPHNVDACSTCVPQLFRTRETHVGGLAKVAQTLKAGLLAARAIEPLYLKALAGPVHGSHRIPRTCLL